jgi:hypothetical protein
LFSECQTIEKKKNNVILLNFDKFEKLLARLARNRLKLKAFERPSNALAAASAIDSPHWPELSTVKKKKKKNEKRKKKKKKKVFCFCALLLRRLGLSHFWHWRHQSTIEIRHPNMYIYNSLKQFQM